MISRRGLFRLLAGAAAAPALKPLEKVFQKPETYTTYLLGDDALVSVETRPSEIIGYKHWMAPKGWQYSFYYCNSKNGKTTPLEF